MTNQKSKRTIEKRIKIRYLSNSTFPWLLFFCPNPVFDYYTLSINENVRHVWEESSAIHGSGLFHHDK